MTWKGWHAKRCFSRHCLFNQVQTLSFHCTKSLKRKKKKLTLVVKHLETRTTSKAAEIKLYPFTMWTPHFTGPSPSCHVLIYRSVNVFPLNPKAGIRQSTRKQTPSLSCLPGKRSQAARPYWAHTQLLSWRRQMTLVSLHPVRSFISGSFSFILFIFFPFWNHALPFSLSLLHHTFVSSIKKISLLRGE